MKTEEELKEFSEIAPFNKTLYRIYKFLNGEKMPPSKLVLTPTDRCNLNCLFCPNYVARKAGRFKMEDELSDEKWIKFIREAIDMGVSDWIFLGGGEPWLRGELILKIIKEIKQKVESPYCEVFTNGTLFKPEEISELVELEISRLTFSVHCLDEEYVELTGGSKEIFFKLVENLKLFSELKKKFGKNKPQIQINMVINNKNYTQIEKMINFAKGVGANILALHPMRGFEETKEVISHLVLSYEKISELKNYIEEGKKLAQKQGIMLDTTPIQPFIQMEEAKKSVEKYEGTLKDFLKLRCFEPWYSLVVNPDGLVGRCTAYIVRDEPLNIRDMSLKEIWYSEYLNQVRDNVRNGIMMVGCEQCGLMSTTATLKKAFMYMSDWIDGKLTLEQIKQILKGLSMV
ncbi:MAG: radical SAM protein [Candidatus Aenigmatarchaeota archaeon]